MLPESVTVNQALAVAMALYGLAGLTFAAAILVWRPLKIGAWTLYGLGFATLVWAWVARWTEVDHLPMKNMYEVFLTMAMLVPLVSLFSRVALKIGGEWFDAAILGCGMLGPLLSGAFSAKPEPMLPALQSPLFGPHVGAYLIAYVLVFKGAVQAAGTLSPWTFRTRRAAWAIAAVVLPRVLLGIAVWQAGDSLTSDPIWPALGAIFMPLTLSAVATVEAAAPGTALTGLVLVGAAADLACVAITVWLLREAELQSVNERRERETAVYRMMCWSFPLVTFGLVLGAVWGKLAWGDYWNWDPKELWSLATWVVLLSYLHLRATGGRRYPRIGAALVVFGAMCVVVTLLAVNLSSLLKGLHSYA